MKKLYEYQQEAVDATDKHDKGIVVMPTGTGKTFIQASILINDIRNNPGFRIYVINAPRIMLSIQLLKEVFEYNIDAKIDARYMAVHSGKLGELKELQEYRKKHTDFDPALIPSSTSTIEIKDMVGKAKSENQPLIFLSTYNSTIRIQDALNSEEINIALNDEAHYLTQERFNSDFNKMDIERKYFFTATTKETPSSEGLGMNNSDFYGNRIHVMTPLQAINLGKMVRPRVHYVSPSDELMSQDELDKNLGRVVIDSFNKHSDLLKNGLKGKMLIAASGTNDMKQLIGDDLIFDFINGGGKFYAVASDKDVDNYINGKTVSRVEWLKQLQIDGSNANQEMIVIHYDILTEGIDVPGLTGVLFLRNLKKSKFIQTLGRVARLNILDRKLIDDKIITPNDLGKMNKPYAWIILPALKREDDDKVANLEYLIEELRDYGFDPKEDIEPNDRGNGNSEVENNDIVPTDNSLGRNIAKAIENYEHVIEDERVSSLTWEDIVQEEVKSGRNNDTTFDF